LSLTIGGPGRRVLVCRMSTAPVARLPMDR
jgi:hypothetical protein